MSLGFSFRERMAGPFALGATDPTDGKVKGRRDGQELAMRVAIDIDDLDAFIADRDHRGGLSGVIDFTPWGDGLPASRGVFNLFSPSGQPDLKLMVYELAFAHGGTSYYLAGKKEVRDDPGFDLWRDTTTLFTTLHEGDDASGPVVGAGVLSLGVRDLIKLVGTMAVPGADSAADKARAVSRFGRFFLGELWDTYVRHTDAGGG